MINRIIAASIAVTVLFPIMSASAQSPFADQIQVALSGQKGDLYGSLVIPSGDSVETVILIVPDSGPTDRDGNQKMMRNNAYRLLAVNLASHNIATLRYDKRGVGASRGSAKESDFDMSTYVDDVKAWISYLRRDGRFKNVVLIGHGEGSLVSLAALIEGAKANGLISIGGMGRSFDQVLKDQLSEEPYYVRNISNSIIDSLKNDKPVNSVPFYLSSFFRPSIQPFIRSIMKYDPQHLIRNLRIPVAIIQGDTDLHVKVEDARLLHAANNNSRLIIIVGMNHVMKNCPSTERDAQIPSYVNPTLPINADLVKVITGFINQIK